MAQGVKAVKSLLVVLFFSLSCAAQYPQISTLKPTSTPLETAAGAGITMTLYGSGFTAGSVAQLNGSALATTFVSAAQLTATVPASDLLAPTTAYITVLNGSTPSAPAPLQVTNPTTGAPLFSIEITNATSGTDVCSPILPPMVFVGDYNHDGAQDVLCEYGTTTPYDQFAGIKVMFGRQNGRFNPPVVVGPAGAHLFTVADFNGDGNQDIFYGSYATGTIACFVQLGAADGTFGAPISIPGMPAGPCSDGPDGHFFASGSAYAAADINGDGKLDLVTIAANASYTSANSTVMVFFGNGDGTFQAGISSPTQQYESTGVMALAPFFSDGNFGLCYAATSDHGHDRDMVSMNSNGDGTFSLGYGGFTNVGVIQMAVADVNGDGNLDLLFSNDAGEIYEALGNGDGTPCGGSLTNAAGAGQGFALGDFRGVGRIDIVGFDRIALGNGDGTFNEPVYNSEIGVLPIVGDFNGDGKPDLFNYYSTGDPPALYNYTIVTAPTATVPASLAFSSFPVGTASPTKNLTLENKGSAPLYWYSITVAGTDSKDFTATNNCPNPLEMAASCTISVVFKPTAEGARAADVVFHDNAYSGVEEVALSGTGVGPVVSLTSSLGFGNQTVGIASAPQTVTLTNTGNAAMTITSVGTATVDNGTVSQSKTCGATLAAGASCTISLTWTPGTAGAMTGSIKVTDNAPGSPQVAALSGTGVLPNAALLPSSLSFPSQVVYTTSAAKTITLTNAGLGELVISKVAVTGPFTQTNACGKTVAAGGTCTFSVKFTPTGYGTQTGTLTVTDNAPSSPQHVALTGIGQAIRLTPTSLTFGNQPKGSSSPGMSVTVANQGATAVTLKSISLTGADATDFSQTHTCGASLASGARCTVSVVFKPTTTGKLTATLAIADNGGGSPQTVALSGTGTP
jgi:Abnormal spindle-like microcephaly-assoc'd, ASPM-SPD-2-Hydin/FG-GAP-like repeat